MKKLFFAALIALAGFTACGTKNVETAATEATEQREVGGGDIAYVQVEAVLAQSDVVRAVTEPMSAEKMHALAQNIRRDENGLFFAALEEEIC